MKKIFVFLIFACFALVLTAQNPFKPVSLFPTQEETDNLISLGLEPITGKWALRFDATQVFAEVNRNAVTKELVTTAFSGIGPAIGYQHFIPTSATDPTPKNNYGVSAGLTLGDNIFNPDLNKIKVVLAANVWQYFKFGIAYTPKPLPDLSKMGFFFGGGITF
jgi:hypothetical protein